MPPRRRPKRRRYLWLFLPLLLIALPFGLYGWLQSDSGQAAVRTVNTLAAADGMGNRSLMEEGAEQVQQGPPAPRRLATLIAALGSDFDGDVGIAVRSVEKGWVAAHKAERLYPQQSVSKLWVAMTLLDRVDAGDISLDDPVTLTQADLTIFHQPVRKRIGSGSYTTDIADLLSLAMTRSDNTANDALFRRVGGQSGVQAFLAEQDIQGVRISPGEKLLQMAIAGMEWDNRYSTGRTFWRERDRAVQTQARAFTRRLSV
ncbi:serine hydrolase [Alterisphingorhabdus coralli]|uniref:beta-lactamase n=1 Tax=Alterisphingorhabdus coralli TaxID=3071408 RepID=A0AA97I181_9SPHN|nr:serine hydrolase [Parasphingorhabdus sp. SCSIO 66989]WOE75108.1 serine hydrolase [Parasphingorhabdus sp. SCSIO 66989]